ncbi:MAG: alpha/beta hydrolase [Proteobacteria bacterium]|nr:alpha/beta hydrolase [Pseudomonadota bacterium]
MQRRPPAWYDEQYNNRARIPDHPAILKYWADASAAARAGLPDLLDVSYGDAPSERLDIFPAAHAHAPVFVYLHGGYWRALDKRDQSFIAPPLVEGGAMVVVPNYALCPAVTIEHIVLQIVRALAWVYRHAREYGGNERHIVVGGHSAGGHLAAMMLACRWTDVGTDLPADLVKAALAISGIYDLEPIRLTPFLAPDLKLTQASARQLSPARMPAPARGRLAAVVGGGESEEFLRQNELIRTAWGRDVVDVCERVPDRHHMNVLNDLAYSGSRLHAHARTLLGLAPAHTGGDRVGAVRALMRE